MKSSIITLVTTLTLAFSSCVQLPDINPDSNEDVITNSINTSYYFTPTSEFIASIDVNGNGTTDFNFIGQHLEIPGTGLVHSVRIEGVGPLNTVTTRLNANDAICGQSVQTNPIRLLGEGYTVNSFSRWGNKASFYVMHATDNGCYDYVRYVDYSAIQFFGVKFVDNGQVYYGWIELKPINLYTAGMSGAPEQWKLIRSAYNGSPNSGLRIPA